MTSSFFRVSPNPSAFPVGPPPRQCSGLAQCLRGMPRTAAQTQNLDVVPRLGPREGQDRRRKEHGLVIGMGDEEADALVAQRGEARGHDRHRVEVRAGEEDDEGAEGQQPVHGGREGLAGDARGAGGSMEGLMHMDGTRSQARRPQLQDAVPSCRVL